MSEKKDIIKPSLIEMNWVDFRRRNAVINACATGSCWEAALAALAARAQALGLQKNLQGPGAGGSFTTESVGSRLPNIDEALVFNIGFQQWFSPW